MLTTVKLIISYPDDRSSYYGILLSREPFVVQTKYSGYSIFNDSIDCVVHFHEEGTLKAAKAEVVEDKEGVISLNITQEKSTEIERQHYRVNFKGNYMIRVIENKEMPLFVRRVTQNNAVYKSSISNKVKNIIKKETSDMQNVLKFLLEIDNKLEEMLTFLRSEEDTSDLFSVKAVDVSGGGLSFFSKETYPEETLFYIMGAIRESFYKVDFAAIGKIVSKENTPEGFIYGVHFVTIDEDIREDIIKFVFEREREMIKEVKETV